MQEILNIIKCIYEHGNCELYIRVNGHSLIAIKFVFNVLKDGNLSLKRYYCRYNAPFFKEGFDNRLTLNEDALLTFESATKNTLEANLAEIIVWLLYENCIILNNLCLESHNNDKAIGLLYNMMVSLFETKEDYLNLQNSQLDFYDLVCYVENVLKTREEASQIDVDEVFSLLKKLVS